MLLTGRQLLGELDRGCLVDVHNGQFAGRRSSGVHVEIEAVAPGVCRAGAIKAGLTGPGSSCGDDDVDDVSEANEGGSKEDEEKGEVAIPNTAPVLQNHDPRGSGSDLRFRFAQPAEPGAQVRFGSARSMNPNLNIWSGSGANPVHRVREPDRGQSIRESALQ